MTLQQLKDAFDEAEAEFLKFDRIPLHERYSNRPDLHAFITLDKALPGENDLISSATHDEYWLSIDLEDLAKVATPDFVRDLHRCGVRLDTEYDSLALFA